LPPKADMCGATRDVRFGPIADIRSRCAGPSGASAWRGASLEICIKPVKGRPISKIRKIALATDSPPTINVTIAIRFGRTNTPKLVKIIASQKIRITRNGAGIASFD
jgi:hypothetical protein